MTDVRIKGTLPANASESIGEHARALYDKPGSRRLGIIELKAEASYVAAPGAQVKPYAHLFIANLEIAGRDQEEDLRRALRALFLARTARGTLDEDGQMELSEDTVRLLGDHLAFQDVARLRAALDYWARKTRDVVYTADRLTDGQIRAELKKLADGLEAALRPRAADDEDDE